MNAVTNKQAKTAAAALASVEAEGLTPNSATQALMKRFSTGSLTPEQLLDESRKITQAIAEQA